MSRELHHRNIGLDAARMLAILPVLLVHYATFAIKDPPRIVFILGEMGVDVFFALSGFLIGGIILRDFAGGFSVKVAANFYARRWMRTLPLYWVFFAGSAFITVAGFRLDQAWSDRCWMYLLFLQNLAWPLLAPWYHESWSLAVEEWFYLGFPLGVAILPGLPARARVLAVAFALAVIPLALRAWSFDASQGFDVQRRIAIFRLDSIAMGILAVAAQTAWPETVRRWRHAIGLAGILGTAMSIEVLLGRLDLGVFFLHTLLFTLMSASFAALVLWARNHDFKAISRGVSAGLIRWASTRSYALYLCHGSIVKTMLYYGLFAGSPVRAAAIFFPAAAVLAEIAHRLVERPFMKLRPRELRVKAAGPRVQFAPTGGKDEAVRTSV